MGLSHGTPQSGRFYPGLEAERKADTLLTHAPGPPGPWPDRALLSSLGRVGPGLTLPGEACPIPRLGACNEKWVSREARRGAQSQAWRPRQQRGQGPSLSRHPLKYYTLPLPHTEGLTLRLEALLASTSPASASSPLPPLSVSAASVGTTFLPPQPRPQAWPPPAGGEQELSLVVKTLGAGSVVSQPTAAKHPHITLKTRPEGEEGKVDSSRCPWC